MKIVQFIALALLATVAFGTFSISHFEGPPFTVKPTSGMYQIGGLGFDNITNGMNILAYGDFNNDKYTDIVVLGDDQKTLTVHIYSHESFSFWPFVTLTPGDQVASVVPGDYNNDGQLDLLIVVFSAHSTNSQLMYYIRQQTSPFFVVGSTFGLPNYQQPLVFDVDGDRQLDLLYFENGVRMIQTYANAALTNTSFSDYLSTAADCQSFTTVAGYSFTTPHSNTFADFNGDCAGDLLLQSQDASGNQYLETWLRNPTDGKFCLVDVVSITTPISTISVGDMNNDGRLDLVYALVPTSTSTAMTINVLYNQYVGNPSKPCTLTDTSMKKPFDSSSYFSTANITGLVQVVNLPSTYSVATRLFSASPTVRPSRIRLGDINIDGYNDLLFITNDPSVNDGASGFVALGINQAGTILFNSDVSTDNVAYYSVLDDDTLTSAGDKALTTIAATSVSFFDFDELGKLGIWIVSNSISSASSHLIADFNFVNSENFILKTLGLTGIKPTLDEEIGQSLGGIYYGASIECTVTDINGKTSLSKAVQFPQSAYVPLDLPYMFIGLGRTNNYVENFVMGISKSVGSSDVQQTTWTPIIPNSQLIVNPLVNSAWTLDVFVNPTSETILIVLTALVLLLVLGAVIIYLHSKEKEEDEQGRTRIYVF